MDVYLHLGMHVAKWRHAMRVRGARSLMELHLQFGYGMMEHCRHLLGRWGGGTTILSPRDLTGDQLVRLAGDVLGQDNVQVLLDPQFYLPHADHDRLRSHDYWPREYETGVFWQGPALAELLTRLVQTNTEIGTSAIILPGMLAATIDDDWLETQRAVLEQARALNLDRQLLMTVALSADAGKSNDQVARLLDESEKWGPDGYYLVCEHPGGQYLAEDPNWLANVLDIVAGFRLRGKRVILGYCGHQMLIAAAAKVNAICSGTWMNVRSFPPDKFRTAYDDEIKQRAKWYYCPQALSEYKLPFLDMAQRQSVLSLMQPPADLDGGYVAPLFSGAQPTSVGFTEQAAFRHYLFALRQQATGAGADSFDDTVARHNALLDGAETLLARLVSSGVSGQLRDFREIVDVNRAALSLLVATRGPILRRVWSTL